MIQLSPDFNLGKDTTRMKDTRDALRQTETASHLLRRLFHPSASQRWELQLLADEVGMGKTFVSLAVAYSVLQAMSNREQPDELRGCYQKILIVTPHNHSLFKKWLREVDEFVRRCVHPEHAQGAGRWFKSMGVERIDDLARALSQKGTGPSVLVVRTGIFGSQRLTDYDLKRRFTLGVVFRYWGNRFNLAARERLLRGAPEGWPGDSRSLTDLTEREKAALPCDEEQALGALHRLDKPSSVFSTRLEKLLEACHEVSAPYQRGRDELFRRVEPLLVEIYRAISVELIRQDLPLVIVDEAHNWKNGPSQGANGYDGFREAVANRTRRMLLLTATPFQLRPQEVLELLRISDDMKPQPDLTSSAARCEALKQHREQVVSPVLTNAALSSRSFARAWSRLPARIRAAELQEIWDSRPLAVAREQLDSLAAKRGAVTGDQLEVLISQVVRELTPDVRTLFREALKLYAFNRDLSEELGKQVVRHRRNSEHRLFRIGEEFRHESAGVATRPDRHVLHAAAGLDVKGEGELPHYLLMRCVTEMHRQEKRVRRSSLGTALTGCYSTLLESAEGKSVEKALGGTELGRTYLDLLMGLVGKQQDARHPKVEAVVDRTIEAWNAGEKTLIFCFRNNTARRLQEILTERIEQELVARRERCLGGAASMKALRGRLTRRDGDLIVLGLDRVLWSFAWALRQELDLPTVARSLSLQSEDLSELARLGLTYKVGLAEEVVDRVFLTRATEHVIARRLLRERLPNGRWRRCLEEVARIEWVEGPYGLSSQADHDTGGEDAAQFDERGVHAAYRAGESPSAAEVERLARVIEQRRERAKRAGSVYDAYGESPSLWLSKAPHELAAFEGNGDATLVAFVHDQLARITVDGEGFDWEGRRRLMQALRRAVLRESVLVRLLPERSEREESQWGELLVSAFFAPMKGQSESMAHRIGVFLEDVAAASGSITVQGEARHTFLEATRLRDGTFVSLVHGGTDQATRERAFGGFNTPLLPEILICTSVGAEGIDLHRHCRHVIHYDLAWNPAVVEQRTGRIDRIGSKTFRERELSRGVSESHLEVSVPFLAGTYDERMYEELRIRAQMFEVLTGGEVSSDNLEGRDDVGDAEGEENGVRLPSLPSKMVDDLRVRLHVWADKGTERSGEKAPAA